MKTKVYARLFSRTYMHGAVSGMLTALLATVPISAAEASWTISWLTTGWTAQVTDGTWTVTFNHADSVTDEDGNVYSNVQILQNLSGPEEGGDLDMSTLVEDVAAQGGTWSNFLPVGMHAGFAEKLDAAKVTSIKLPGSMKVVGGRNVSTYANRVYSPYLTNIVVNAGLNTFGGGFASFATNLVSVSGLETVRHLTWEAFRGCVKLERIDPYLPAGLVTIGVDAFRNCSALTGDLAFRSEAYRNIDILPGKPRTVAFNDAITNITVSFAYAGLESVGAFPASLQSIGSCFADWSSYGSANLPLTIDMAACTNLFALPDGFAGGSRQIRSVILPPRIRSIGESAMQGCAKLTNVVYVADMRFRDEMMSASGTVGANAFLNCTTLKSVEFPWGGAETTIGEKCFAGAYGLRSLKFDGMPPQSLAESAFDYINGTDGVGSYNLRIYGSSRQNRAAWIAFAARMPTDEEKGRADYPGAKTFGVHEYSYSNPSGSSRVQWLVWEKSPWDLPQGMIMTFR